jgi:DNA-binding CsgD family transcriptional regulator
MLDSVRKSPLLCLGFTLYWIWMVFTLQGPLRFPLLGVVGIPLPSWSLTLLFSAGALAFCAACHQRVEVWAQRHGALPAVTVTMFIGLGLSTLWIAVDFGPLAGAFIYIFGSCLMGVGAAALLLEFCRVYADMGTVDVLFHGAVAMLGASAYQFAITFFNLPLVNMLFMPFFPVAIGLCLSKTRNKPLHKTYKENRSEPLASVRVKLLLTIFLQGLAVGTGLGILLNWGDAFLAPRAVASLCAGAAALVLLLTAMTFKAAFSRLIYLVGFPIMATGFLVMACSQELLALGNAIQAVGSFYQYIIMLCLMVYLSQIHNRSIIYIVGAGVCSLYVGQVLGGFVGTLIVQSDPIVVPLTTITSILCAVLLICALYISNHGRIEASWEQARPGTLGAGDDIVEKGCRIVAAERQLTSRETDILLLAARGRNKHYIADELCIADETVKRHLRNIYLKLDIHSQQELIDAVTARTR